MNERLIAAMQIPLGAGDIAVIESAEPLDDYQAHEIERRVRALYDQLAKAGNVKLVKLGPADTLKHEATYALREPDVAITQWEVKHPTLQASNVPVGMIVTLYSDDQAIIEAVEEASKRNGVALERRRFDPTVEAIRALAWGAQEGDLLAKGWLNRLVDEQGNPKDDAGRTVLQHGALANSGLLREDHSERAAELVSMYGLDAWTMAEAWSQSENVRAAHTEQALRAIADATEGPWCECCHCDADTVGRLPIDAWRYAGSASDFLAVAPGHGEAAGLEVIRNEDGYDVVKPTGMVEAAKRTDHWLGDRA